MKAKQISLTLFILFILVYGRSSAQWWNLNGTAATSGDFIGTTNTVPLELKTTATGANAQNINFYTDGSQRMTILGNNTATTGFVGIYVPAVSARALRGCIATRLDISTVGFAPFYFVNSFSHSH